VVVAIAASSSGNSGGATLLGALAFTGFFVAAVVASGYQTLRRRATRDESAYRGPSPFLVFGAVFAAANVIAVLIHAAGLSGGLSQAGAVLLSVGVVVPLYAGSVLFLVVREDALSWRAMGWPPFWTRSPRVAADFAYGVGLAVPTVLLTLVVATLFSLVLGVREPDLLPVPVTPADWFVDVLVAVVLAPFGEELFFRGFAQTAWMLDIGPRSALLRAALFFAIVHALNVSAGDFSEGARLAIAVAAARIPVALALGWVFSRTGSIASSLGLHAAFNGVTLILFALVSSGASPG